MGAEHQRWDEKLQVEPAKYLPGALQSSARPSATSPIEYTCPMHPEIVRSQPGNCPICGMTLEPRTISAEAAAENPELRDMRLRAWSQAKDHSNSTGQNNCGPRWREAR